MADRQPFHQAEKKCPLCLQDSAFIFQQNFAGENEKFSLFECHSCGGQFWLPFKNPGADWYVNGDKFNVKDNQSPRCIHGYHKKFLNSFPHSLQGVKALDLGCGTGEFLAELEKRGADVYGTDLDAGAIEIAKKHYGLKNIYDLSISSFFQTVSLPPLDLITAFEVFEHVDDPILILAEAKKHLKPGGRLIISVPSRERFLRDAANWDYPFHHLSRWNEKAIRYHWESSGFKNTSVRYMNKFQQLYELFLDYLADKLKFKRAAGLKKIARGTGSAPAESKNTLNKFIIKIVYKTGRWVGVVMLPYILAGIVYPIVLLFYPRSGLMYIEAVSE